MNTTWIAVLGALAVLGLMVLGYWRYRVMNQSSGRDDRYSPERLMTPEQAQMLDYLQDTFPGQVVLPNMMLKNMLAVRRATNRQRAEQRLNQQRVDFVVCGADGKPTFAFDIEQHPLSNAEHKADLVKMKNRILRSAGVRFVFLKNGLHRMPSPAEFRKQLNLAELPKPKVKDKEKDKEDTRDSRLQQLESHFSEFDSIQGNTSFPDSEVMGLSGLMDLDQEGRRSGFSSAYSNSDFNQRRPGSSSTGSATPRESRFDSMDVRGGR